METVVFSYGSARFIEHYAIITIISFLSYFHRGTTKFFHCSVFSTFSSRIILIDNNNECVNNCCRPLFFVRLCEERVMSYRPLYCNSTLISFPNFCVLVRTILNVILFTEQYNHVYIEKKKK